MVIGRNGRNGVIAIRVVDWEDLYDNVGARILYQWVVVLVVLVKMNKLLTVMISLVQVHVTFMLFTNYPKKFRIRKDETREYWIMRYFFFLEQEI